MVENRVIAPQKQEGDEELYRGLRPQSLDDFVGQRSLCQNLRVFVNAARDRKEAMDHVLLFGPPGQDYLGADCGKRIGRQFPSDFGAHDFQSG